MASRASGDAKNYTNVKRCVCDTYYILCHIYLLAIVAHCELFQRHAWTFCVERCHHCWKLWQIFQHFKDIFEHCHCAHCWRLQQIFEHLKDIFEHCQCAHLLKIAADFWTFQRYAWTLSPWASLPPLLKIVAVSVEGVDWVRQASVSQTDFVRALLKALSMCDISPWNICEIFLCLSLSYISVCV